MLRYVTKIVAFIFPKRNPQFMRLFIIANNINCAGFNRLHLHDVLQMLYELNAIR
jgi:hypothetical protein